MLTLLYNCQFFAAAAAAAATDELSHSSVRLAVCMCVLALCGRWLCGADREREREGVEMGWHAATLQYSFEGIIDIDEQCCRVAAHVRVH